MLSYKNYYVAQVDEMDCGVAALAMVLKHYGSTYSLAYLRQKAKTDLEGTSALGLMKTAESLDFETKAIQADMSLFEVEDLPLPFIAHVIKEGGLLHYYVVLSIKYIANSNNPFSIEESNDNVINVYFYPLGIALCERGNHSQLSAKLKGVGETSIERIMNIEHVYDHVNYDGIYFYHIFSENEETNPYRFKAQNRTEFLAGIIFEIGRLLKNYPELFPEEIKFAINNKEKIKQ